MPITINGSGTITGASSFPTNTAFGGTVGVTGTFTQNSLLNLTYGQISFPATQNPSIDPNTLDDYEEGYFTAFFSGSATGSGIAMFSGTNPYGLSHTGSNGRYTKIGRRVYFNFYVNMASTFSWANGYGSATPLWIGGLPFVDSTSGTGLTCYPAVNCGYNVSASWSAAYAAMGIIESGQSTIRVGYMGTNSFTQASGSNMASAGNSMIWSGHYETSQ